MAKEPDSLKWIEDFLPQGYLRKPMFGGFAYYVDEKIVLALFESFGDRKFKDQTFDFDLWNGCLFPTERENHEKIKKLFPILFSHPVLSKWLYLPVQTEDFENQVEGILKEIRRRSNLFGVVPKPKKKKLSISTRKDTRRPSMFANEKSASKSKSTRRKKI